MTSRERVSKTLRGETPDRVPLSDSYWVTTVERWHREGLPSDIQPGTYFGTDEIVFLSGDYTMQFPERVVEENDRIRVYWDSDGALKRDLFTPEGWTSQWLDFTIKDSDDWREHSHRLSFNNSRIPSTASSAFRAADGDGKFVCYSAHACFHPTWMRIGMENELMMMLDQPEFISELLDAHTTLVISIFEGFVDRGIRFDGVRLADDLGYRTSTLVSPALYRELIFPHHQRLCTYFAELGLPTILHSDGNIDGLIPDFIEAGFCGLHPLEVKAGLDFARLRSKYGNNLVIYGNIDARALAGTPEEIEREISTKLSVASRTGRYIFHSDHSVPNNVPLENYRLAMEFAAKYGSFD